MDEGTEFKFLEKTSITHSRALDVLQTMVDVVASDGARAVHNAHQITELVVAYLISGREHHLEEAEWLLGRPVVSRPTIASGIRSA